MNKLKILTGAFLFTSLMIGSNAGAVSTGILNCNGQVKQDTLLSRLFIKFPLILDRGLIEMV